MLPCVCFARAQEKQVEDLSKGGESKGDGKPLSLSALCHQHGVNLRLLGLLHRSLADPECRRLVLREMIVR